MAKSPSTIGGVIAALSDCIDFSTLSDEDLAQLANATTAATTAAEELAEVVEGIGCLIAEDIAEGTSGALQDSSTPHLLWFISRQVAEIAIVNKVGSDAAFFIKSRRSATESAGGTKHG
ncbi:hypothetical protein BM43_498 [Burkholderia gladioli]|uniref:Uncharacterized protein n=1 Tax=Burkholderia gladioli TaxID=28095 RepID=A0A095FGM6_BURGA|nr:hypothetical protein [Burkholderia gladioli]AJW97682.1 hypothetical protein BM43_498 [Burkholderia gladioli]ASD80431.1 hypothetical protein CEJ98_16570 [Burkholderia gladioli pv. gladioli]AWY54330.1 hypothetical protein A8H28_24555 [Burkholderia gladioli pv. gladioli]KGC16851.1 hypothetical protein DM48_5146 [Burkholderia gladioli]PEH37386.1 hypothetical protein CRM94_22855 [Burkholderia gladioli]